MQPSHQQPPARQQHTSSRMLQSLLHTYTQNQHNSSSIGESYTIHDMQYEEGVSYRSNASEKQESRLIELIEKKESQLKTLETFLIKEFQQISESKEKQARIRGNLQSVLGMVGDVKRDIQIHRGTCQELQQLKQFMKSQVQDLALAFSISAQTIQRSYKQQIANLESIVSTQAEQLADLKSLTSRQSYQISKLTEQLAHNTMANSSQPFKLDQQHLNKAIQKKESKGQLSQQQLQVSFSADKSNKAKQLINVIFHLKSNESLLLEGKDGVEVRASNKTVQEEHPRALGQEQRTLTGGFNHILLKGSTSSHSQQSNHNEIQLQQASSPPQLSQCIQTSQVRRISSNANYANNDASSAINKLDVFSELNPGDNFQDDDMSYENQYDDEKYSEIEFRNMKKAKISRSMKATRNVAYGTFEAVNEGNERLNQVRLSEQVDKARATEQRPLDERQSYMTPPQQPKPTPNITTQKPQLKNFPNPSKQNKQKQLSSPNNNTESPNTKTKKFHRYDYCRLYQEQQIKEIQNINTMCSHLMSGDKQSAVFGGLGSLPAFSSFEKITKELTPTRKNREISPRKASFSMLQSSKFDYSQDRETPSKSFVRSGNSVPSSFSNSKKSLTIQIPASPQRNDSPGSKNQSNPYLKLQNHLHQLSYQQFSPKRSNYANEKSATGYLERSQGRSRASYSDLRTDIHKNIYPQEQIQQKLRKTPSKVSEQHIITNNIDRKQYIKSKIQMIKKKNSVQNAPYQPNKSPHKISFIKSQDPQNHVSKQQLQRPNISRQVSRHNRSTYEQDQQIRGYDFSEDKFEKQMMEKSRRTDKSQLKNSAFSKGEVQKSKDTSRVSYSNANNVSYSKVEKNSQTAKDNLNKSSSSVAISQQEQYNNIYQQLNQYIPVENQQHLQHKNLSIQQQASKKPSNRPTQPLRQSVSPLRPTSKNNNNMYLPQDGQKYSMKKPTSMMDNQYKDERYNEENLYKHPYMMDRKRTGEMRVKRNEDDGSYENVQLFRRF